jgi:hypothetical protein
MVKAYRSYLSINQTCTAQDEVLCCKGLSLGALRAAKDQTNPCLINHFS